MYYLLGICLALAALLKINILGSLVATAAWLGLKRPLRWRSALARARVLFALRIFPAVGALISVAALIIPAYIVHEPRSTNEEVSPLLAALALLSLFGITIALWRGVTSWRATMRLVADWLRHAEPVTIEGVTIPTYRFQHIFPVIAVVGPFRPRLFIADQIFDSLTREELAAAVSHEKGHLTARDTFKRAVLRICCDVLSIMPAGRALERAWAEESERAADENVARAGAPAALDLAGALVKITRIVPVGAKPAMPAGAYLLNKTDGSVTERVRRLTEIAVTDDVGRERSRPGSSRAGWFTPGVFLFAVPFIAADGRVLATTYAAIEYAVRLLS